MRQSPRNFGLIFAPLCKQRSQLSLTSSAWSPLLATIARRIYLRSSCCIFRPFALVPCVLAPCMNRSMMAALVRMSRHIEE